MTHRPHGTLAGLLLLVVLALSGCATPATTEGMTPNLATTATPRNWSVAVDVTGGCTECAPGVSFISDQAFSDAVVGALRKSGLFARGVNGPNSDYRLSVRIIRAQSALIGLDMTSSMEAAWTLSRTGTSAPIWRRAIETTHTSTFSDAAVGAVRVRLTWEGAARRNIEQAIEMLSGLTL